MLKVWLGAKTQRFYATGFVPTPDPNNPNQTFIITPSDDFDEFASEIGASISGGGFTFLANFETGDGIGILADGDRATSAASTTSCRARTSSTRSGRSASRTVSARTTTTRPTTTFST